MRELPISWKLFRMVAVVQLILFAFLLIRQLILLPGQSGMLLHVLEEICFAGIFWFLFLGQTLLHENYPDIPLEPAQKRRFNWLFIISVAGIIFLSGHVISEWRQSSQVMREFNLGLFSYLRLDLMPAVYSLALIFHIIFVMGMFLLRSGIHRRAVNNMQEPFGPN